MARIWRALDLIRVFGHGGNYCDRQMHNGTEAVSRLPAANAKTPKRDQATFMPSKRAALPPSIAAFCWSVRLVVAKTWSTGCCSQGIGWSVPSTTWLAPTCATRCRKPSGVNTIASK